MESLKQLRNHSWDGKSGMEESHNALDCTLLHVGSLTNLDWDSISDAWLPNTEVSTIVIRCQ